MREIISKICGFILLMGFLLAFQSGLASDYPDFVGYVNDYAHLLSAPQASTLNQELRDFDNRTTIEVAVVTVNSIGSENPQDYAVNLANYWGVGKRDKNNGIIFLVAMQSHDIWIEVGPGLSGQFSDRKVQQIVDNVIIPQFRANRPDLGVINGVHSIISHFEGAGTSKIAPISSPPQDQDIGNPNFFKYAESWLLFLALSIFSALGLIGWSQSRKNKAKIDDLKKRLNKLMDRELAAIEALKDMKANYVSSIWKSSEEAFNLVDREMLELELARAERTSNRGLIFARAAQSQVNELESDLENAEKNIEAPISKLAGAKKAQKDCATIMAGLDAAFLHAEKEMIDNQISMATRMNLETSRHIHQEVSSIAKGPANTVDWIALLERLAKLQNDIEKVSKDAARDRAIAEKIQGQDAEELLAKMKKTLDEAEKKLEMSYASRPDLEAARREYSRALDYHSGRMNTIDLYLIYTSINSNIERGYRHQIRAVKEARHRDETGAGDHATAIHHTGFGSSGSSSFGGGRMGGGSGGGGKW